MYEENGLNIYSQAIYSGERLSQQHFLHLTDHGLVLGKPGNFRSLSEISFSGIQIRDSDIQHIHHLPNLAALLLDDTGITNEACVHFVMETDK